MRRAVLLLLAGALVVLLVHAPTPPGPGSPDDAAAPLVGAATVAWHGPRQCDGIGVRRVRGARPAYVRGGLAPFANHRSQCRGLWLPLAQRWIVPQALALDGRTAWVVGYRNAVRSPAHPCRILRVSLATGRLITYQRLLRGRVGSRPVQYCRHGGGVALTRSRLWIVEKGKLWMIRTSRVGRTLDAQRVWRIHAPVRGSSVIATRTRLGIVPFARSGHPRIRWFSIHRLVLPRARDLALRGDGHGTIGSVASSRIPTYVQGAVAGPTGRLYLTRSSARCGELVKPSGRRVAFVPGAEQVQLGPRGGRLWVVSESGARAFQRTGRPLTPALSSFEWPRVLHGPRTTCHF